MRIILIWLILAATAMAANALVMSGKVSISGEMLMMSGSINPPSKATNFNPSNGATRVNAGATFSWSAASGASSYDVYFNGSLVSAAQAGLTWVSTTGYNESDTWRVDPKNVIGTTTGDTLSFTSMPTFAVTTLINFEAGTIGANPTVTDLNNGTTNSIGTWSLSTNAPTYSEIAGNNQVLYTPLQVSTTVYTGTGTRSMRFRMDQIDNCVRNNLTSTTDNCAISYWMKFGPNGNFQTVDTNEMQDNLGGFLVMQMNSTSTGTTGNFWLHWDTASGSDHYPTSFALTTDTYYRVSMTFVRNGVCTLKVYTVTGILLVTQTVDRSTTGGKNAPLWRLSWGRTDSHGGLNPPTTSWLEYDNIGVNTSSSTEIAP